MSFATGSPVYWMMMFAALFFIVMFLRNHYKM